MSNLNDIDQDESFLNRYAWHIVLIVLVLFFISIFIYPEIAVAPLQGNVTEIELIEMKNKIRATFTQIAGGIAVLFGLYITHKRMDIAENNLQITQEGQITERFTRAIDQLGDEKAEIRLGGIYALERISKESKTDYWPIMEILASYVRLKSPLPDDPKTMKKVETDIQAICTVLGNRVHHESDDKYGSLDLRNTNLRGVYLEKYHLRGINFIGAHL